MYLFLDSVYHTRPLSVNKEADRSNYPLRSKCLL